MKFNLLHVIVQVNKFPFYSVPIFQLFYECDYKYLEAMLFLLAEFIILNIKC